MNSHDWFHPGVVGVEFEDRILRVQHRGTVREWSLGPGLAAGLDADVCALVVRELTAFLGRKPWQQRLEAACLIPGSGVSLRRWKIPRGTAVAEISEVLRLRIEGEFPLSPEELAWGWLQLAEFGSTREMLVGAVKRTTVERCSEMLSAAGLSVHFVPAALARLRLFQGSGVGHVVLDVGAEASELLVLDEIGPVKLRVLAWGRDRFLHDCAAGMGVDRATLEARWGAGRTAAFPEGKEELLAASVAPLAEALESIRPLSRVLLTGVDGPVGWIRDALARRFGAGISIVADTADGEAVRSSALRGLRRDTAEDVSAGLLELRASSPSSAAPGSRVTSSSPRKWAVVAGAALLALLGLPYAEAFLLQPRLAARVGAIKEKQDRLRMIDRESDFLRYIRQNQTASLETLFVIGKCSPPGARIDSFSLDRKGELALRVSLRQPPEVVDFRNKLVESGYFSSVVLEEQAPSPDRQKISARISARLKAPAERAGLKILSTNDVASSPGGTPGNPGAAVPGRPMPARMP